MSDLDTQVNEFFKSYETANASFDVEQLTACYADVFLFGGPDGVQCIRKEDFLKVLPRRKEYFKSVGYTSSKIQSLEVSALDSKYTLAKVVWNMRFERRGSEPVSSQNSASYVVSKTDGRLQIVFQIDHQDLRKRAQELGLV